MELEIVEQRNKKQQKRKRQRQRQRQRKRERERGEHCVPLQSSSRFLVDVKIALISSFICVRMEALNPTASKARRPLSPWAFLITCIS